jgi:dTDP-4-amino-4,6-dideoxygalactose transaminase
MQENPSQTPLRSQSVPFLDLRLRNPILKNEIRRGIGRVIRRGQFVLEQEVLAFEAEWAAYCGVSFCCGVGNGLDALQIALKAVGVGPGDEVLVPSNTFIATWFAVSNLGATPVAIDPAPGTYNMDPEKIQIGITKKTRAIVPVHLYGHPAELSPILEIAKKNRLPVVEDAAQAHGATYEEKKIGGHGDLVAWSFYPGKNLGAMGDGGAITTNNSDYAKKIRLLRNYGSEQKYQHEIIGFNSRLDAVQAAVLRVKLRNLDQQNQVRANIAGIYSEGLRDLLYVGEATGRGRLRALPTEAANVTSAWHLYPIEVENRSQVAEALRSRKIATGIHYPVAPASQGAYSNTASAVKLGSTRALGDDLLSLPMGPHLRKSQAKYVVQELRKIIVYSQR